MNAWTEHDRTRVTEAEELEIATYGDDGTLRPAVTIWVVGHGDEVYVRSAKGRDKGWFRHALASGRGRVRAGGYEGDVTFVEPGPEVDAPLDEAYHVKYDEHHAQWVGPVVGPVAARATLRVTPA